MNKTALATILCAAIVSIAVAASPGALKRLTPQRIAELTDKAHTPQARGFTVEMSGFTVSPFNPDQNAKPGPDTEISLKTKFSTEKPEALLEYIREFRFPTSFNPPEVTQEGGTLRITTPTYPRAFEMVNTGWTVRLKARPIGKLIELYGTADYIEAEMHNGGYGPLSGPIHDEHDKLISPNVVHQPTFQTTTTHFHLFAVPGEPYDVVLYKGKKARKHRIILTEE